MTHHFKRRFADFAQFAIGAPAVVSEATHRCDPTVLVGSIRESNLPI
jgi:hypothetical protein